MACVATFSPIALVVEYGPGYIRQVRASPPDPGTRYRRSPLMGSHENSSVTGLDTHQV